MLSSSPLLCKCAQLSKGYCPSKGNSLNYPDLIHSVTPYRCRQARCVLVVYEVHGVASPPGDFPCSQKEGVRPPAHNRHHVWAASKLVSHSRLCRRICTSSRLVQCAMQCASDPVSSSAQASAHRANGAACIHDNFMTTMAGLSIWSPNAPDRVVQPHEAHHIASQLQHRPLPIDQPAHSGSSGSVCQQRPVAEHHWQVYIHLAPPHWPAGWYCREAGAWQ